MKYATSLVALLLSATILRGQVHGTAPALTIYTKFSQSPSSRTIADMKSELDAVMRPFHMRFDWRSLDRATGHEVVDEVMVVHFKGACQADPPVTAGPRAGTLGWTHVTDGEILPFADVDCDKIREVMAQTLSISPPAERAYLLGRAMARVLAHELYHFLAHTTKHASSGIAKATYTRAELTCDNLRFDEAQLRAVREQSAHHPAGEAVAAPGLSEE